MVGNVCLKVQVIPFTHYPCLCRTAALDKATGQQVQLSDQELDLIGRLSRSEIPDGDYDRPLKSFSTLAQIEASLHFSIRTYRGMVHQQTTRNPSQRQARTKKTFHPFQMGASKGMLLLVSLLTGLGLNHTFRS